jgi:hypothetical protein
VSGAILTDKPFFVGDLKIFDGTDQEAYNQALLDRDQFVIRRFLAYRGDPETRTTVEFEVEFVAGAIKWLPWTLALFETVQYEEFCRRDPALMPLLYNGKEASSRIRALKRSPITAIQPGTTIYLNIRWYSHTWYKGLQLPDLYRKQYVVKCTYGEFLSNTRKQIYLRDSPTYNNNFTVDNFFVYSWGSVTQLDPDNMIVVTKEFIRRNPSLK